MFLWIFSCKFAQVITYSGRPLWEIFLRRLELSPLNKYDLAEKGARFRSYNSSHLSTSQYNTTCGSRRKLVEKGTGFRTHCIFFVFLPVITISVVGQVESSRRNGRVQHHTLNSKQKGTFSFYFLFYFYFYA